MWRRTFMLSWLFLTPLTSNMSRWRALSRSTFQTCLARRSPSSFPFSKTTMVKTSTFAQVLLLCCRYFWGGVHWGPDEPAPKLRQQNVPTPCAVPVWGWHYKEISFSKLENPFLKTGKSSEWRNLRNPRRAELQIRWKKILANPEPQSARLSSASSDWNHISWEMQRETDQNPVQIRKVLFLQQQIYISFSVRGAAREGNLGEVEWMNYVKQWKSFSSSRFVSVSSPQQEAGGYII